MLPSVVATALQSTLFDYLRTTFSLRDKAYERALLEHLSDAESGLFRGPYVDLRLPFRPARGADCGLQVLPPFEPYAHQLRAWQRLDSSAGAPSSTLVATGTGSGKTECFLYPLLDHCYRHRGRKGIKAIILYPMNALASDQAERFAKEIHNWTPREGGEPQLRGQIHAGLYVGGKGTHPVPDEHHLVDMREHLRKDPPDILLTNYRMLDFLLLRPEDSALWRHNSEDPSLLQYLVLDELHTYDGAQGTDVAFLIRRLKRRLRLPKGQLCCVGTSATIGGDDEGGRGELLRFAQDVFGQPFTDAAILVEDRLSVREALPAVEVELPDAMQAEAGVLSTSSYACPEDFLDAQARLWLGDPPEGTRWVPGPEAAAEDALTSRLALGTALAKHQYLRDLLTALGARGVSGPRAWQEVLEGMPASPRFDARSSDERWLVLSSFLALVAHARKRGESGRVEPFMTLQVQLWVRELRRLLRRVPRTPEEPPRFAWYDELRRSRDEQYAVQVYCRECGDVGLGAVKLEGKDTLQLTPEHVGKAYLQASEGARYLRPGGEPFDSEGQGRLHQHYLCPASGHLGYRSEPRRFEVDEDGHEHPIPMLPLSVHGEVSEEGRRFLRRCPACGSDEALSIIGSRAASLSSVAISTLYTTPYNSDPKLLAFTDSVQDASHRASFFAGRTFRFVLRTAMQAVLERREEDLAMARFVDALVEHWGAQLGGTAELAATLLPPDLRDEPNYRGLVDAIADPEREPTAKQSREVDKILRARLSWELAREFGLGVVIGRSLDRTSCATATPDPTALAAASERLHLWLHETRPVALAGGGPSLEDTQHFLAGLVERLRSRGGVHEPLLDTYVKHGSKFFLSRRKNPYLSRFGPRSRYPQFAYHGKQHKVFEALHSPPKRLAWYRDWCARALGLAPRDAGINDLLSEAMRRLADVGLVETRVTQGPSKGDPKASGLAPAKLVLTREVELIGCASCGNTRTVAAAARAHWTGRRCTTYRCEGQYQLVDSSEVRESYYRKLFRSGRIRRVFAAEHTGLLERGDREALELAFKRGVRPDAPNLLTCTPTLEMGIDIGDLSAVMLCSVPPLPANYLQRVGRAGRSTGNALVLTIANARPHDRYFYEQPEQMMRGKVDPPACFLDAPEMLTRQLVAHALDHWAEQAEGESIPRKMRMLLGKANKGFPHSFYSYYEAYEYEIAADFMRAYARDPVQHPAWKGIREQLDKHIKNGHIPRSIRAAFAGVERERADLRRRRDALSRRKAVLEADPGAAVEHPEDPANSAALELADLEDAMRAYLRQLEALGERYPLNVLTDAGVLPNYAFPEPGVTLSATLLGLPEGGKSRSKAKAKTKTKRHKAEYTRPASSALREFAPFNSFYAEGRRIQVTQLDLGSKQAPTRERWRFCSQCSHSERDTGEPPAPSCPVCGDGDWKDQGQVRELIEFRKAWSTSSLLEASTADESDEREQESYRLVTLIESEPGAQLGSARLIEADDFVFGFELMPRAVLREINFGRSWEASTPTQIAGEAIEQPGFMVCASCGRVQEGETPQHLPWCKVRTAGELERYEPVGLYRQTTSEAIKLLLPVADHELGLVMSSFQAALELGFRRKFGGQPTHLKVTRSSEPAGDARRNFLVIYDTVPGGTGYLSELWREGQLFELMSLALDAMRHCVCVGSERDGCYRCVYAHQHQRDLASISRARATRLFARVLERKHLVKHAVSLSEVELDSLLESELELRFLRALRKRAEPDASPGQPRWRLNETVYRGGQSFRLELQNGRAWDLRLQQTLGQEQGVAVRCRPDFVFVPVGFEARQVAVFTDGFAYHVQPKAARARLEDDILKRRALLDSGRYWVWSLTWADVQAVLDADQKPNAAKKYGPRLNLLGEDKKSFATMSKMIAKKLGHRPMLELRELDSFTLLTRWLEQPEAGLFGASALCSALSTLPLAQQRPPEDVERVRAALLEQPEAPPERALARTVTKGQLVNWSRHGHAHLLSTIPYTALETRDPGQLQLVLRIFDRRPQRNSHGFGKQWRAFLQAWNLLQFHDVHVTSSERLQRGEPPRAPTSAAPVTVAPAPDASPPQSEPRIRAELYELLDLYPYRALFVELSARELPAPEEPEEELLLGGREEADFELLWPQQRVALLSEAEPRDRELYASHGWLLFDPSRDDPREIAAALASRGEPS